MVEVLCFSCFVVQYFVSFLVLQSSLCETESWLLYCVYLLGAWCHVTVIVLMLFLTVSWVGLQCELWFISYHSY